MYTGGNETYSEGAASVIRYVTASMPIILIGYGLLIGSGVVIASPYYSVELFLLLSFLWSLMGIDQLLRPTRSERTAMMRLIVFHLLASAYVIGLSGFSMPLSVGWIILVVASNVYFGRDGIKVSLAWMLLTVAIDAIVLSSKNLEAAVSDLISLVGIILAASVIFGVYNAQHVRKRELTRSKNTETVQRERILTLINNLADAVISTDQKGIIKIYNAASLNLLDTNQSLNGKHIDSVVHVTDDAGTSLPLFDTLQKLTTTQVRQDVQLPLGGDDRLRLELTLSPIRGVYAANTAQQDGYVVILRDITRAKSLEEERDEFISVVSHELRTPITITEGSISNAKLMLEKKDANQSAISDSINMAHDQVLYLAKMVNDLSTLSRAERGAADAPEEINVKELAHSLYNKYTSGAHEKGLTLDLDVDANVGYIRASRLYIEELLQNFVTNAIKYTIEGSVKIAVQKRNETIDFAVSDTGVGMSKADQQKVFDKFYRVEDYRTRETNGTGLGLYVSAKLAKKLKTHITLKSRLNHGSTFSFTLPVLVKRTTET